MRGKTSLLCFNIFFFLHHFKSYRAQVLLVFAISHLVSCLAIMQSLSLNNLWKSSEDSTMYLEFVTVILNMDKKESYIGLKNKHAQSNLFISTGVW